jgi:hypothetical protein
VLARVSQGVRLINTGANTAATLLEALGRPWVLEGGGAVPFPFAFHNGVFVPVIFILGSTGAMPFLTVFLLLMLASDRGSGLLRGAVLTLILASLALSAEHLFVFLALGLALAIGIGFFSRRNVKPEDGRTFVVFWGGVLVASALLAAFQGGFLTEAVRQTLSAVPGPGAGSTYNVHPFEPRWPPALPSAHFAELSLLDAGQAVALLAELGPVLLLAPIVTWLSWRHARRGRAMRAALGLAALLAFTFALLVRYGVDRSSTRLPGTALWLWLILGIPAVWIRGRGRGRSGATLAGLAGVASLAGVVILAIQLTAIPRPQFTHFIDDVDTRMTARYWNALPEGAQVLDRLPYRSVTIFGRPSRSFSGIYDSLPEWRGLVAEPVADRVAAAGYGFVYVDPDWWHSMAPSVRESYRLPCVRLVKDLSLDNIEFRRLYDVRECGG